MNFSSLGLQYIRRTVTKCTVLEFGEKFTKVGLSGESTPRVVYSTPKWPTSEFGVVSVKEWVRYFRSFFHEMYFEILLANPKKTQVVVCEELYWSYQLKKAMYDVLFELGVKGVLMVPAIAQPTYLFPSGVHYAIMIDIGYSTTRVAAISDRAVVTSSIQASEIGMKVVVDRLRQLLVQTGGFMLNGKELGRAESTQVMKKVPDSVLEDILAKYILVPQRHIEGKRAGYTDCEYPAYIQDNGNLSILWLTISPEARAKSTEALFDSVDTPGEGGSLPELVAKCLEKCSCETRAEVVSSVAFIGGGSSILGIQERVMAELDVICSRNETLKALAGRFKLTETKFPPSMRTWTGASVSCALGLSLSSFKKEPYSKLSDVPDWSRTTVTDLEAERKAKEEKENAKIEERESSRRESAIDSAWGVEAAAELT
ncbi:hypothetical protein AAMO2058_000330500 [Amorphochlora amoebiformis]|uniref:Uncharacterized protein n=1 Tax=Amorphochlora amoebiformis TaxID=1561963 RepID=A0A7S0D255_9EUKA|mmetsp:Transcript_17834/g.28423  ORF Transcript_17834/g.28423 Transcript_17834/m.28423 type:complete len:428 (+) Transcript_17834:183-1466(+)